MAIKVASHKLVDLLLALGVKVLELVEVPHHVESVGRDHVGLALDQVLSLDACDLGDGRERVGEVSCCSFDAVSEVEINFI